MSQPADNLVLEHLKKIQAELAAMRAENREVRRRPRISRCASSAASNWWTSVRPVDKDQERARGQDAGSGQDSLPGKFAEHAGVAKALEAGLFFARPYRSRERGLNGRPAVPGCRRPHRSSERGPRSARSS